MNKQVAIYIAQLDDDDVQQAAWESVAQILCRSKQKGGEAGCNLAAEKLNRAIEDYRETINRSIVIKGGTPRHSPITTH